MSTVFRTIEEAKKYCEDSMDRNAAFITFPPQHPFKDSISVENVIQKIDNIKQALSYVREGDIESEAGKRLRTFTYENHIPSNLKRELYSIAAHMDNELNLVHENEHLPKAICLPLVTFLESYKNNGGQLNDDVMEHILNYCSQIETQYQKVLEHEREIFENYLQLKEDVENFIKENVLR